MNKRMTAAALLTAKSERRKLVWLTAYDTISAELAEASGVDVLLVGDSLGMVSLGFDTPIPVTLDQMIHHTAAVTRGRKRAWVVCDLPFGTYQQNPQQALASSVRVMQEAGCDAVKLEGGEVMAPTIRFLAERGIAVVAHIGLTPQSVKRFGGFFKQGQTDASRAQLLRDARAVEEAGALAVVLECIPEDLAREITHGLSIPTVGIGAGPHCDAQVLVWHDLLGLSEKNPPFAPAYANLRETITRAITQWSLEVHEGKFPR